jgi:uncharacterized protein (TIGR02145 family)
MKKVLYLLFGIFLVSSCSNNETNAINNDGTAVEAPIAPTNLTLTNISPTQIDLSWTDNSNNETGFKIERRKGTDPYTIIGSVNANVTTFSDTKLIPNGTYAYKVNAFNANTKSSTNSNEVTVTASTPIVVPTLITTLPSSITPVTASSGGNIESDGGAIITARGVVWSVNPNPITTLSTKTIDGTGAGSFTSAITTLTVNTTYYVRAYATNSAGTAYGNEISFTTSTSSNTTVSDIDGNIYQTAIICNVNWTTTNLNVTKYRNGDVIPQVTDPTQWGNLTTGAWCYYANTSSNGITYGKLYNWYAVNDPRGLAPVGYHIPSDTEWGTLVTCLGGEVVAGGKMKETGTTHWGSPNTDATNTSGFTGLPGGYQFDNGLFGRIGSAGFWWSSSEYSTNSAGNMYLASSFGGASSSHSDKRFGFSVRCVRN